MHNQISLLKTTSDRLVNLQIDIHEFTKLAAQAKVNWKSAAEIHGAESGISLGYMRAWEIFNIHLANLNQLDIELSGLEIILREIEQ